MKYSISCGTVQPYVTGFSTSPGIQHFGRAEYDRNLPVLSDSLRAQAAPIVAELNAGTISENEARKRLRSPLLFALRSPNIETIACVSQLSNGIRKIIFAQLAGCSPSWPDARPAGNRWPLAAGRWPLAAGRWPLAAGRMLAQLGTAGRA